MVRTTVASGFAAAVLAKKLFCVLAGCAFATLSSNAAATSRSSVSNIDHYVDLVLGTGEVGEYIAWTRVLHDAVCHRTPDASERLEGEAWP